VTLSQKIRHQLAAGFPMLIDEDALPKAKGESA